MQRQNQNYIRSLESFHGISQNTDSFTHLKNVHHILAPPPIIENQMEGNMGNEMEAKLLPRLMKASMLRQKFYSTVIPKTLNPKP